MPPKVTILTLAPMTGGFAAVYQGFIKELVSLVKAIIDSMLPRFGGSSVDLRNTRH